ncbi:MAG: arsenical pump-driving ATPase [Ferrimicrobium sp.]|jgi:arsenite-transporting ATPase
MLPSSVAVTNSIAYLGSLLEEAPRFLFFTGKGGVGKTSTASAVAVALADRSRSVLLVSTDPASNLDEVLGVELSSVPRAVPGVDGLEAFNIDPNQAASDYRERVVSPYRGLLPASAIASIEEQLSGSCTVEIAAFDEFVALLADSVANGRYDHIVFDTAPTGHTLRLLSLPEAWSEFINTNSLGVSCVGPLSGLANQLRHYRSAVSTLKDPNKTVVVLVARPEDLSLAEMTRTSGELVALGIGNQRVVINGVLAADDLSDPLAAALTSKGRHALSSVPTELAEFPLDTIPLFAQSPIGVQALRSMLADGSPNGSISPVVVGSIPSTMTLASLVAGLASSTHGLIMAMGKGGVGKTTVASAIAVELARLGHRVDLTTTDPAAHLDSVLGTEGRDDVGLLRLSRIDPEQATTSYVADVLHQSGDGLTDSALAVLKEDLRSPCTMEVAVFREFARTVASAQDHFVVVDTAPTGHTLLLLDSARSYHRDIARQDPAVPLEVDMVLDRLRDPEFSSVVLVTVAESTPVHEAAQLQVDLRRAGIKPKAWIVNQSLAVAQVTDPILVARAANEIRYLREISSLCAGELVLLPMVSEPLTGSLGLAQLLDPEQAKREPN